MHDMMEEIHDIETKINELTVLKNELSTLKKGRPVYQQQPNSNVYFLADRDQCQQDCQKSLQKLSKQKTSPAS